jgi:uncharacterized protein YukE
VSADGLRVTPEELAATAGFADDVADQLVDEYQRLADEVNGLLDGRWTGTLRLHGLAGRIDDRSH